MSVVLKIDGLNSSASPWGKPRNTILGFPADGLQGLYLFEDGAVGSSYSGTSGAVTDSSGHSNHAPLVSGSNIIRTAAGVKTGDASNAGWIAKTPIAMGSYTRFAVAQNRQAPDTEDSFPALFLSSANASGGGVAIAENYGAAADGTYGKLVLNFNSDSPLTYAEIGLLNADTASDPWAGAGSVRPSVHDAGSPKASWIAIAYSLDAATGLVTLRALGQTITFADLDSAETWLSAVGAKHMFGMVQYAGAGGVNGDSGIYAIYNFAMGAADLDSLIVAGRARMALRGVTAI